MGSGEHVCRNDVEAVIYIVLVSVTEADRACLWLLVCLLGFFTDIGDIGTAWRVSSCEHLVHVQVTWKAEP